MAKPKGCYQKDVEAVPECYLRQACLQRDGAPTSGPPQECKHAYSPLPSLLVAVFFFDIPFMNGYQIDVANILPDMPRTQNRSQISGKSASLLMFTPQEAPHPGTYRHEPFDCLYCHVRTIRSSRKLRGSTLYVQHTCCCEDEAHVSFVHSVHNIITSSVPTLLISTVARRTGNKL